MLTTSTQLKQDTAGDAAAAAPDHPQVVLVLLGPAHLLALRLEPGARASMGGPFLMRGPFREEGV